jgi:hypothetical protein
MFRTRSWADDQWGIHVGAFRDSATVGRRTPVRARIYHVLLSAPLKDWTIRDLATACGDGVSTSSARDTVYTLIAAAAMTVVPGTRAVTVRLTAAGLTQLQSIVSAWPPMPQEVPDSSQS